VRKEEEIVPGPISIDSRGYGKIYKAAMRNRKLPLLAKTIYAYFCAYAGNGYKAFPKRDKIVRDLNINKDTYTKHLNTLVSEGYIGKERTTSGNIYTIMQTVPGYENAAAHASDEMTDMIIFENIKAKGFGTVPKLVMLDGRLTAQAKGIYAYFASFAGAGTTAFPRRSTIMRDLKLSAYTYYSHFNILVETGYLSVEQRKTGGKFDVCIYRLSDCVELPSEYHKKRKTSMSEKLAHGENGLNISNNDSLGVPETPMSEKLIHGGNLLKTSESMSEKPMSEKLISEELVCENFGQANINNIPKTNSTNISEQEYNHQGLRLRPDDNKPVHSFSLQAIKQRMNYDHLQSEAEAWGNLKELLGHFSAPSDRERYLRAVNRMLEELAFQLLALVNNAENPEHILHILESEDIENFFDEVLARWDEIRSAKRYVAAALKNILRNAKRGT